MYGLLRDSAVLRDTPGGAGALGVDADVHVRAVVHAQLRRDDTAAHHGRGTDIDDVGGDVAVDMTIDRHRFRADGRVHARIFPRHETMLGQFDRAFEGSFEGDVFARAHLTLDSQT